MLVSVLWGFILYLPHANHWGFVGTGLLGEVTAMVHIATGPFGTVTSLTGLGGVLN